MRANSPLNVPKQPSPSTERGWRGIEKQLRDEGVLEWREAVKLARENGCSPADIQAVIDYFCEHRDAWKSPAGALFRRVVNATPDQRPDDPATWLPMKPAAVRQKRTAENAAIVQRLSDMSHHEIRAAIEWAVGVQMLRPLALEQFDDDANEYLKIIPNQTSLAKLMAVRDAASIPPDPTAQPPPADSSDQKQKRTPRS